MKVDVAPNTLEQLQTAKENTKVPMIFTNPGFGTVPPFSYTVYLNGEPVGRTRQMEGLEPGEKKTDFLILSKLPPGEHIISIDMNLPRNFPDRETVRVKGWQLIVPGPTVLFDRAEENVWTSIGPQLVSNNFVGRIVCFAYDPVTPTTMYAGAYDKEFNVRAAAGVWKTLNGGQSWFPIGDKLPSMMISSLAVDPMNPSIIYAGTTFDGIFKSVDGGKNWEVFAFPGITGDYITKISVHYGIPGQNPKVVLYVASNKGVLRYTTWNPFNLWSITTEWSNILQGKVTDLKIHPSGRDIIYASMESRGLFRTNNGVTANAEITSGTTKDWIQLENLPGNGLPRLLTGWNKVKLDIFPQDPVYIYAGVLKPRAGIGYAIYRSEDDGNHFNLLGEYPDSLMTRGRLHNFNAFLRVHPFRPDEVYTGGVEFIKWSGYNPPQGNLSWFYRIITNGAVDLKEMIFKPPFSNDKSTPLIYYLSCDQGIFRCQSIENPKSYKFDQKNTEFGIAGDLIEARNQNLAVTQMFDFDVSSDLPPKILAGTQDMGSVYYERKPVWKLIKGGDGFYSVIAPSNSNIMYAQHQDNSSTDRTDNLGQNWTNIAAKKGLPEGRGPEGFIAVDLNNPNTVLMTGSSGDHNKTSPLYVTENADLGVKDIWNQRGPKGKTVKGKVRRMVVQPHTNHWFVGTTRGQIWTTSAKIQGTWSLIDEHPEGAVIESMAFSSANPNTFYIVYGSSGTKKVKDGYRIQCLEFTPGGGWNGMWITDNLDLKHARSLRVICADKFRSDVAYIGTERGVFRWDGRNPTYKTWSPYNNGFPLTTVTDLKFGADDHLYAATKGRGAWMTIPDQ